MKCPTCGHSTGGVVIAYRCPIDGQTFFAVTNAYKLQPNRAWDSFWSHSQSHSGMTLHDALDESERNGSEWFTLGHL